MTLLVAVLMIAVFHSILQVTSQQATQCPTNCQCSSQYFVYCQSARIKDHQLADVISKVSRDAILLDLSSNEISRLPSFIFTSLPNLEYLNIAANSITELPKDVFKGLSNLRELTLNGNKITTIIPGCFDGLSNLKDLKMEDNLIESVSTDLFRNLSMLEKLQIQNNRISELMPYQFTGLVNLKLLNLSQNLLQTVSGFVFSGLRTVKQLLLSNNKLFHFSLDAFSGLTGLEELILDRNNISDIIFMFGNDFFLSLNYVSLTENHIVSIPSHVFPHNINLKRIDLSSNIIRRIGGHSFNSLYLESLILQNNNISQITRDIFKDSRRISSLNLGHNEIVDILTGAFDSIRDDILSLDIQFNKLTNIHPGMFRGMRRLKTFNLAGNRISNIEPGSLGDLVELQELNLSGNLFTAITSDMIIGAVGLKKLVTVCNPLQKLVGFNFQSVSDKILIEANSTIIRSTSTSAVITWPYKEGSQLYWSLSINCANYVACEVPPHTSTLRPYLTEVTVTGLRPGATYFICVMPVFLSSDVNVSQCVHFRTPIDSITEARHSTDPEATAQDSSSPSTLLSMKASLQSNVSLLLLFWFLFTCLLHE